MLAALGFGVTLYGFFVEYKVKRDTTYKPACDISDRTSCTKAFTSEYSTTFGISNTILGMIYYATVFILALLGWDTITFLVTSAGALMTIWFAYLLYVRLKIFCVVCTTTYLVNIGLFIISFYTKFGA